MKQTKPSYPHPCTFVILRCVFWNYDQASRNQSGSCWLSLTFPLHYGTPPIFVFNHGKKTSRTLGGTAINTSAGSIVKGSGQKGNLLYHTVMAGNVFAQQREAPSLGWPVAASRQDAPMLFCTDLLHPRWRLTSSVVRFQSLPNILKNSRLSAMLYKISQPRGLPKHLLCLGWVEWHGCLMMSSYWLLTL